ncbi:helix-turn-helix domain-containing protein [Pediococcus claussenii]|uniref:Mga helix-turn-helix domain protein n=1 Tax=Pediococcus claussenii (strain ATCC BAA-344 / DSM 14800 / JCM 18046 / KCTC 3811 / LMG 21948 / P06) TaxID=701521 RepID=G8PEV2_PEDCP|nr:helix-turn-helix domain-containing protein [Pediococcus claussenii]AEV94482.1 mga helix-turn-helix domain protein [Pediococcus claussenii ATCC BAA-344]KRN19812.1 hypothetical protein IV79_GL001100 [Pediococcus claussenii]
MDAINLLDSDFKRYVLILRELFQSQKGCSNKQLLSVLKINSARHLHEILSEMKETKIIRDNGIKLSWDSDRIFLSLEQQVTFGKLFGIFLEQSALFNILHEALTKSSFSEMEICLRLNISHASYYRYIKRLNKILEEYGLVIKKGELRGYLIQKYALYYGLYWSTQQGKIFSQPDLLIAKHWKQTKFLCELIKQEKSTDTLIKTSFALEILGKVVATHHKGESIAKHSIKTKNPYILGILEEFRKFVKQQKLPEGSELILFIFFICYVADNDTEIVEAWEQDCKANNSIIYQVSIKVYQAVLQCKPKEQFDTDLNHLILIHTLFFFKEGTIDPIEGKAIGAKDYIWMGLDIDSLIKSRLSLVLNDNKFKEDFFYDSLDQIVRYYSLLFFAKLPVAAVKIRIGVYSGDSTLLTNYIKTMITKTFGEQVIVENYDFRTSGDDFDLIISDVVNFWPKANAIPKYQIAMLGSERDQINILEVINDLLFDKLVKN